MHKTYLLLHSFFLHLILYIGGLIGIKPAPGDHKSDFSESGLNPLWVQYHGNLKQRRAKGAYIHRFSINCEKESSRDKG